MAKLYEITSDVKAIADLMESMVDENGEPREPTAEEMETMRNWITDTEDAFKAKFDNYCKFIRNLNYSAADAESEKKNFKAESERLTKRAKAFENRAKAVQSLLRWNMERLNMNKYKTELFSAGIQNTQLVIQPLAGEKLDALPNEYLKPRELDTLAIKQAIKDGLLKQKDGPENYGKLFTKEGVWLRGITVAQGSALVIR